MGKEKKRCNLYIDRAVAIAGRKKAIDMNTTFNRYVEELIRQDLYREFLESGRKRLNEEEGAAHGNGHS